MKVATLFCMVLIAMGRGEGYTAVFYASPTGSGNACTNASPCSRSTGMNTVRAGDTLVLKNGTYVGEFSTVSAGIASNYITIQAQNKWEVRFAKASPCGPVGGNLVNIIHDWIRIRGIVFNFCSYAGSNGGVRFGTDSSPDADNIIFEHNRVLNTQASGLHLLPETSNIIIRHNEIIGTGHRQYWGEAFYLHADNVQVYGNTVRNFTENGMDIRVASQGHDIHHNIFEGQRPSIDQSLSIECVNCQGPTGRGYSTYGVLEFKNGANSLIYDNIIRNNMSGWGTFYFPDTHRNVDIYDNVIYSSILNPYGTDSHIRAEGGGGLARNEISNNTACNLATYVCTGNCGNLNIYDNAGFSASGGSGVPQSNCSAEVTRILDEIPSLAGYNY